MKDDRKSEVFRNKKVLFNSETMSDMCEHILLIVKSQKFLLGRFGLSFENLGRNFS